MLVFFVKVQNTQYGYHRSLSSLMDPLVPKMRRLRLQYSHWDRELLRLIPPLIRGRPRRRPLARKMWPPTWGQIKNMMTIVTGNLGMARNPTTTLLAALVIITIQVGVVQGDAYWTFMLSLPNGTSLGRVTPYLSLLMV
jgi:hypothetical protein